PLAREGLRPQCPPELVGTDLLPGHLLHHDLAPGRGRVVSVHARFRRRRAHQPSLEVAPSAHREVGPQPPIGGHVRVVHIGAALGGVRSEEHTSELQSLAYLVCRLLLEKKKKKKKKNISQIINNITKSTLYIMTSIYLHNIII